MTEAAEETLALSGLIDFGNVRAADAVFDLAKCLLCSMQSRAWYCSLLHRMIMWWLRHIGAIPTADAPSGLIDDFQTMVNT